MLRIASIDNLSARAFRLVRPDFPAVVRLGSPSDTYRRMASGSFDAALVSSVRLEALDSFSESLGAYGIACRGAVSSVRLFARDRLAVIAAQGRPIHASPKSQTSRALLACLFHLDFGKEPVWTEFPAQADAWLKIGEDALVAPRGETAWTGVHDLGQWWHERTGLSFVFARWIVRKDLGEDLKRHLGAWLEKNARAAETQEGIERMTEGVLMDAPLDLPPQFLRVYFRKIRPKLTLQDMQGLEHFLDLNRKRGEWIQTA